MMTELEWGLAKRFENQLAQVSDAAQVAIDRQSRELAAAARLITRIQAELISERAKSADLLAQILGAAN